MYTELQYVRNTYTRWGRRLAAAAVVAQVALFAAVETGLPPLPFGIAANWGILLGAGGIFAAASQFVLVLRVGTSGVSLRFSPYQLRFQHISWDEVRQLRLMSPGEHPAGAPFGLPGRDFTHAYRLSTPHFRVLHITLVNGTQIYVSTERPKELLDFLHHVLYLKHLLPKREYPMDKEERPMPK